MGIYKVIYRQYNNHSSQSFFKKKDVGSVMLSDKSEPAGFGHVGVVVFWAAEH